MFYGRLWSFALCSKYKLSNITLAYICCCSSFYKLRTRYFFWFLLQNCETIGISIFPLGLLKPLSWRKVPKSHLHIFVCTNQYHNVLHVYIFKLKVGYLRSKWTKASLYQPFAFCFGGFMWPYAKGTLSCHSFIGLIVGNLKARTSKTQNDLVECDSFANLKLDFPLFNTKETRESEQRHGRKKIEAASPQPFCLVHCVFAPPGFQNLWYLQCLLQFILDTGGSCMIFCMSQTSTKRMRRYQTPCDLHCFVQKSNPEKRVQKMI